MRARRLIGYSFAVLLVVGSVQGEESPRRSIGERAPMPGRAENIVIPDEVKALHQTLSALSLDEQRTVLRDLKSSVRVAVWMHNMDQFAVRHPQLTAEQRTVLAEGRELLATPNYFDIVQSSPSWPLKQQRLAAHKERAERAFSRQMLYEAFIRIGEEPFAGAKIVRPDSKTPPCNCINGFECYYVGSCVVDPDNVCLMTNTCGWWGGDWCTGTCAW
jgi:hypothetical protein